MWNCPKCNQKFIHENQNHSCNERTLEDLLQGKSAHTIELFHYFIFEYQKLGNFFYTLQKAGLLLPPTQGLDIFTGWAKISLM